jgi:glycosyltransferase involved in cell wall biosynthesis
VGDGPSLVEYRKLVKKYSLDDHVVFYGRLSGKELDAIFDQADIAVCSLGCHRINVFLGSFLKSREYLARGLPLISSTKIDIIPEDYPYCLYVSEDDLPIDIKTIIRFQLEMMMKQELSVQVKEIRKFAEINCDMSVVMRPVIEYILNAKLVY